MRRTRCGWPKGSVIMLLMVGLVCSTGALANDKHGSGYKKAPHSGMMGHAGKKGYGMHHHMPFSPLAMKEELGLSEEQLETLEALETDYRKTLIKTTADVRIAEIDLALLLDQKNPDRNAIAAKIDEIGALKKQLMMYRVNTLLKLKDILTPAQYEKFHARLKQYMDHGMGALMHGGMMGHGMMGGPKMGHGYGKGMMGGHGRTDKEDEDD